MTVRVQRLMDFGEYDLVVVGGGINGAGVARDAAGRGLRVALLEQGDFGGGTSSASTKLIHGGLRYLEQFEFRLVAESLKEREVLLRLAPHLVTPLRFVLPHVSTLRPAWMMRLGLWMYDRLGGRSSLPPSGMVRLSGTAEGAPLKDELQKGFVYWDAWVDDARLVIANLRSAVAHGAQVWPRTRFTSALRDAHGWCVEAEDRDGRRVQMRSRALVNAGGPWVERILAGIAHGEPSARVQLVKGSHIIVPRVHPGTQAYLLQNEDRRVLFVLPYEQDYSLIGTTDLYVQTPDEGSHITPQEIRYLLGAVNRYLAQPLHEADVVWSYSGVRPLYDDGSANPSKTTRDYNLVLDAREDAPLVSVFGGKITTYRKLAEAVLAKLHPWLPTSRGSWTATEALPGAEGLLDRDAARVALRARYAALSPHIVDRLFDRHGNAAPLVLGNAGTEAELGRHFGGGLYECEARYFIEHEWARSADDVLWRRTKAGLHLTVAQRLAFETWFDIQCPRAASQPARQTT